MTNDQKSEVEGHEVKKIILIGNGFDLALGYKTQGNVRVGSEVGRFFYYLGIIRGI